MYRKLTSSIKDVDAIMITSPHNLRYFTKFSGGEGVALITKNQQFLFVDSRYTYAASKEADEFQVIEFGSGERNKKIYEKLQGCQAVAIEERYLTLEEYFSYKNSFEKIQLTGKSAEIEKIRMIKTEEELSFLRKAEEIGVEAFLSVLKRLKVGMTENEVAAEIEYQMRKSGSEGTSFDTIVVSGYKSAMPHGIPGDKKLENGDFVTMDFGCKYKGYCSDMTRTVVMGKASNEQKKIYETVLKAQAAGLDAIKSGIKCSDADKAARDVIEENGYGKYFGHSLGHGVGLLIHELPNLSPKCEIELCENMIVTCEPGIYIPDFGGVRIEDMVCVKENAVENFTNLTKELIEV